MKTETRPYAIFRYNVYKGKPGYWERVSSYRNIDDAVEALKGFTKSPRKMRIYRYVILPNKYRERMIFVEHHDQLFKSAR